MYLSRTKKIAGGAVISALALGGVGAAAWADSPSTTTAPPAVAHAQHAKARSLLGRMDHGVVEIKDGGAWVTVDFDRGKVTDVAADHVTLARPDGQSVTLKLTPTTKYRGVTSEAEIQTGKGAIVISNTDGTARQVLQGAAKK